MTDRQIVRDDGHTFEENGFRIRRRIDHRSTRIAVSIRRLDVTDGVS